MKTRKIKKKKFRLPKEIQNEIKKKKHFQRQLQSKIQNGETDVELESGLILTAGRRSPEQREQKGAKGKSARSNSDLR